MEEAVKEEKEERKINYLLVFGLIAVVMLALQIRVGLELYLAFESWEERAQFGDMFGVVNAAFSGIALAGIIVALFMQSRDLKLQRRDLKLQFEEIERSTKAQEASANALDDQLKVVRAEYQRASSIDRTRFLPVFATVSRYTHQGTAHKVGSDEIAIRILGEPIWNLKIEKGKIWLLPLWEIPVYLTEDSYIVFQENEHFTRNDDVVALSFTDRLGRRLCQRFELDFANNGLTPGELTVHKEGLFSPFE